MNSRGGWFYDLIVLYPSAVSLLLVPCFASCFAHHDLETLLGTALLRNSAPQAWRIIVELAGSPTVPLDLLSEWRLTSCLLFGVWILFLFCSSNSSSLNIARHISQNTKHFYFFMRLKCTPLTYRSLYTLAVRHSPHYYYYELLVVSKQLGAKSLTSWMPLLHVG